MEPEQHDPVPELIALPAPTPWPMITAFGITLLCTGLVTHAAVSVVGLILALRGAVGWFREDLPVESHAPVRVRPLAHRAHGHRGMSLHRQVLATPAHRAAQGQDQADDTDRHVGDQPCTE